MPKVAKRLARRKLDEVETMRSPNLAAVLSLIVAGLDQIYNGRVTKGVLFIVAQLINTALTVDDIKVRNRPRLDSARC
ncbi:MAG: hypothetical protein M3M97_05135 [Actinomycetota bacterium]|nr:hypothetical protein [Actinomycetota bacterium]